MDNTVRDKAWRIKNPCLIGWRSNLDFVGSGKYSQFGCFTFFRIVHGLRAMFSLMRFWQKQKGCSTVAELVDQVWWLTTEQRFSILTQIKAFAGFDPTDQIKYNEPSGLAFVRAFAKSVSNMDCTEQDLIEAQKMIL